MSRCLLKVGDVRNFITDYKEFVAMVVNVDEKMGRYDLLTLSPGFCSIGKQTVPMHIINKQVQLPPEMRDAYNNLRDLLLKKRNIREQIMKLSNDLVEIDLSMQKSGVYRLD